MQRQIDSSERTIDCSFISNTIKNGKAKPKFTHYDDVLQIMDTEIDKAYGDEADINNIVRIINRRLKSFMDSL